jgi:hypothetical protein
MRMGDFAFQSLEVSGRNNSAGSTERHVQQKISSKPLVVCSDFQHHRLVLIGMATPAVFAASSIIPC